MLSCTDSESEVGPVDQHVLTTTATLDPPEASTTAPTDSLSTPPPAAQDASSKSFIPTSDSFITSLVSDRERSPAARPYSEAPPEESSGKPLSSSGAASSSSTTTTTLVQTLGTSSEAGQGAGDVPWSNVDLEGVEAARSSQTVGGVEEPLMGGGGGGAGAAATYPLGLDPLPGVGESDAPVWAWISGGGCDVDASSLISWLSPTGRDNNSRYSDSFSM